jgi:hypothetical protein
MKRLFLGLGVAILISLSQFGLVNASANNFTVADFTADYYLDKDSDGRSTLKTIEYITAEFPNFDQNHGIERAIPLSYDGHDVSLNIQSVTDQNNIAINYSTYTSNGNLVLRIGDSDTYAHGSRIYVISYTQRDITKLFTDTNSDEFYWDINGTEWLQLFKHVEARLHVSAGLQNSLTGKQSCYFGVNGSTNQCNIKNQDNIIIADTTNLGAGENMTIAVGFVPHTFSEYKISASESIWLIIIGIYAILAVIACIVTIILLIFMLVLKNKKGKGAPGRGTIIAEYLPPKGVDVALSSVIVKKGSNWTAATYIDLAVRHNIKIFETVKGAIFKRTIYSFELVSTEGLTGTEMAVIEALFGNNPQTGARHDLDTGSSDYKLVSAITKIYKQTKLSATTDGYYEVNKELRGTMIKIAVAIAILGIFTTFFGIVSLIIAISIIMTTKPLSVKGRDLLDYLKGLELYIKTAEQDRIKILQSSQGAEKTPVDVNDSRMLVRLYERVLPYAVLFGNEKEWSKVLGKFYEQQGTSPDWYVGNGVFNAVLFSSTMSSFASSANSLLIS